MCKTAQLQLGILGVTQQIETVTLPCLILTQTGLSNPCGSLSTLSGCESCVLDSSLLFLLQIYLWWESHQRYICKRKEENMRTHPIYAFVKAQAMEWNQEYCFCFIYNSSATLRTEINWSQKSSPKLNLIQDRPRCYTQCWLWWMLVNLKRLGCFMINWDSLLNSGLSWTRSRWVSSSEDQAVLICSHNCSTARGLNQTELYSVLVRPCVVLDTKSFAALGPRWSHIVLRKICINLD